MMLAIAIVKGLHIAAVVLWGAGLLAVPLMLAHHATDHEQEEYERVRRYTHYGYTHLLTPAAVIAVAAGTALIFLRGVFVPWMFAKLALVGALAALHAWIGNTVVRMGEETEEPRPAPALIPVALGIVLMGAILLLVLAKPAIDDGATPDWLHAPLERQLPLDEVPT
jgi:protoporphyrinogen IX oxidase